MVKKIPSVSMDGIVTKRAKLPTLVALVSVFAPSGCGTLRPDVQRPMTVSNQRGIIFAVDGAGGFHAMSAAVRQSVVEEGIPLGVEPVYWTHGTGRVLIDQIDYEHARQEGQRLAAQMAAYRQACPRSALHVVAHSAGCAVALAAAEALPPDTVDRMVLLAPSVSATYDLQRALQTCRGGIDSFYSTRDMGYLGLAVGVLGTADRRWEAAAGRVGFQLPEQTPEDPALTGRLHQHPWHPCVCWSGNDGGHSGNHQVAFLRAYVLPILK
jgi:pimeloyl-ACP methyl ester carboxylesterase